MNLISLSQFHISLHEFNIGRRSFMRSLKRLRRKDMSGWIR
jgi:hypothetical protein